MGTPELVGRELGGREGAAGGGGPLGSSGSRAARSISSSISSSTASSSNSALHSPQDPPGVMRARGAGQAAAGRAPSGSADGGRRADEGKGVLGERRDEREGAEADRKLGPRSGEGWGRGEVCVRKVARLAGGAGFRVYIRAPSTCGKVSWHQAMAAVVMIDDPWILRAPLLELNILWTSEPQDWTPLHRHRWRALLRLTVTECTASR